MEYETIWKYIEQPRRIIESKIHKILGWGNAEIIQHEVDKHRFELVWDYPFRVVKLLGWTDQYDEDYYYVIGTTKGVELYSCVGGFVWLKGKVGLFDYARAKHTFDLNVTTKSLYKQIVDMGILLK